MKNTTGSMKNFGVCNVDDTPAVFQIHDHIDFRIIDGIATVEVDAYCALTDLSTTEFDVDAWDAQMVRLERPCHVPIRAFWKAAFGSARALLKGLWIQCGNEKPFSLDSHVRKVLARRTVKIDRYVTEEEIAEALGCSVSEVRERAEREGWAYCLEGEPGQPLIPVTPVPRH